MTHLSSINAVRLKSVSHAVTLATPSYFSSLISCPTLVVCCGISIVIIDHLMTLWYVPFADAIVIGILFLSLRMICIAGMFINSFLLIGVSLYLCGRDLFVYIVGILYNKQKRFKRFLLMF